MTAGRGTFSRRIGGPARCSRGVWEWALRGPGGSSHRSEASVACARMDGDEINREWTPMNANGEGRFLTTDGEGMGEDENGERGVFDHGWQVCGLSTNTGQSLEIFWCIELLRSALGELRLSRSLNVLNISRGHEFAAKTSRAASGEPQLAPTCGRMTRDQARPYSCASVPIGDDVLESVSGLGWNFFCGSKQ